MAHFMPISNQKTNLFFTRLTKFFNSLTINLSRSLNGKSPRQALIAYVDFCLSNCHTFSPTSGCAIPSVAIHVSRVGQSARIQFSEGTHRIQCAIATLITRLGRDKDQSTEIAVSLLCEMVGAVSIARAMGPSLHSAKILKRARISVQRKLG
jgi:TetR/AcrR family transcriptional repressor of nem operon